MNETKEKLNESKLANSVEFIYGFVDMKALVDKGSETLVFGVIESKNGFGGPTVKMFCGSGSDREAASLDALNALPKQEP